MVDIYDRVLIVGTGLAAIEVLLALHARGHEGRTLAISRSGRGPADAPPGSLAVLEQLREDLVLVERAAEVVAARVFSNATVVRLRLTGADVPYRAGREELWEIERIVHCDDACFERWIGTPLGGEGAEVARGRG